MNKREQKKVERKRAIGMDPGPITRRQQVAAIRQLKGAEIAAAVASQIRQAVKDEVEVQLKSVMSTVTSCIDRVIDCEAGLDEVRTRRAQDEGDSDSGPERTEAIQVLKDDQVVSGPGLEGEDHCGQDYEEGPTSR